eukprot:TRINITY_DN26900_c0_g1_i1.p1 TRINITY_DN26900_c0_g1~~TRINITY_DN26900_c0_g1_i1.p1  ORF type:complete len:156 (+),score=36.54 TRINITY_DN26900_c0_g1_i1:120-587(+)
MVKTIMDKQIPFTQYGMIGYLEAHVGEYESAKDLEQEANKFMGGFRVYEQQEFRKLKRLKRKPDQDGWTTVVPKIRGVNSATSQIKQATQLADYEQQQDDNKKKKAMKSTDDFYAFTQSKKKIRQLIKIKKSLLKAQTRKGPEKSINLRNFADRC